jgi:hypothetical protein
MKSHRKAMVQDAGVIGWISISEVFLLCGVTMLTVALAVGSDLDQARKDLSEVKKKEDDTGVPALKKVIDDLTGLLAMSNQKAAKLSNDLQAAESKREALRVALASMEDDRDKFAAALKKREVELARVRSADHKHRSEGVALRQELRHSKIRLAQIKESILVPPQAARLIVRVFCADLPENYDLDLYIQDPHNQECYWAKPRSRWENRETGLLILSEDLRRFGGKTEEIYYSKSIERTELLPGKPPENRSYLVSCMIRSTAENFVPATFDIPVHWEVSMAWNGATEVVSKDTAHIKELGRVAYDKDKARPNQFPGLVLLTEFWGPSTPGEKPRFSDKSKLPQLFRGWLNIEFDPNSPSYHKIEDNRPSGPR